MMEFGTRVTDRETDGRSGEESKTCREGEGVRENSFPTESPWVLLFLSLGSFIFEMESR